MVELAFESGSTLSCTALASTLTTVFSSPIFSLASTVVLGTAGTFRFVIRYEAKPGIDTSMVYVPGVIVMAYVPSLPDFTVRPGPLAGVNVTVAPGISSPSGSVTVP